MKERTGREAGAGAGAGTRDVKRVKKSKPPPATMRFLITGYQRWVGRPKWEEDDKVSRSLLLLYPTIFGLLVLIPISFLAQYHLCHSASASASIPMFQMETP